MGAGDGFVLAVHSQSLWSIFLLIKTHWELAAVLCLGVPIKVYIQSLRSTNLFFRTQLELATVLSQAVHILS